MIQILYPQILLRDPSLLIFQSRSVAWRYVNHFSNDCAYLAAGRTSYAMMISKIIAVKLLPNHIISKIRKSFETNAENEILLGSLEFIKVKNPKVTKYVHNFVHDIAAEAPRRIEKGKVGQLSRPHFFGFN
jgi:hypothetical protein